MCHVAWVLCGMQLAFAPTCCCWRVSTAGPSRFSTTDPSNCAEVLDKKMQMLRLYDSGSETPIMVKPARRKLSLGLWQVLEHSFDSALQAKSACARVGQGIAGTVFLTQETVNIPNCYQDAAPKCFKCKCCRWLCQTDVAVGSREPVCWLTALCLAGFRVTAIHKSTGQFMLPDMPIDS